VSASGLWRFVFWERDLIQRFILFCALLAFLIFLGLLGAQNDLPTRIWQEARTVFVDGDRGERRGHGLMAKWTMERPPR